MKAKLVSHGSFKKTFSFMSKSYKIPSDKILDKIGKETVERLRIESPSEEVAKGWSYSIIRDNKNRISLNFNNSCVTTEGDNMAIILENGHATMDGKWVPGYNFIKGPIEDAYKKIKSYTREELDNL